MNPDNVELDAELQISGLRIIRKIIETSNVETMAPASEWETEDWEHCVAQIDAKQNYLVEKGCVEFLCKYISDCDIQEALDEAILVAIALLLGGNNNTQERFLTYMINDENNYLLLRIKEILFRAFDIAKRKISDKMVQMHNEQSDDEEDEFADSFQDTANNVSQDGNLTTEEIEDVEDEDDFDDTPDSLEASIINCNRVLRFLQLLCENHHLGLQNFLRVQTADDVTNNKSFDFVTHIATMFGTFIKGYTICYSSNLGDQLMATLTEFIQGPCKQNQSALINAKVIDNCSELIFSYNSKSSLKSKGFVDEYEIELDELKQH